MASNGRRIHRSVGAAVGRAIGRAVVGRHARGYGRGAGRWVTRCEQVLVPGYWDVQHHPAVFGWVFDACGRRHWGVVEPAHDQRFWVPARYENQTRQVWVRR